jgi:hypothetical protein
VSRPLDAGISGIGGGFLAKTGTLGSGCATLADGGTGSSSGLFGESGMTNFYRLPVTFSAGR